MNQLYIIEGIPGSGKTTTANHLEDQLKENHVDVKKYIEGDLHPADMAWNALVSEDEFQNICNEYPSYADEIMHRSIQWNTYWIVPYTTIEGIPNPLRQYFESKEVYDGRVETDMFCKIHEERWKNFGDTATGTTIFECALLQNAVNELLLFHNKSQDEIEEYITKLLNGVSSLHPVILYLDIDPDASIDAAASQRVNAKGKRVWEEMIIPYICNSPYGKLHHLEGSEGMKSYFATRKKMELEILKKIPAQTYVIQENIETQTEDIEKALHKILLNQGKDHYEL